jgi:uncharacterized membrane protein
MGTVIRTMGVRVATSSQRGVKVLLPPPAGEQAVMFARARRPGHARLEALVALAAAVSVFTFGAVVVREVARAHTQVEAATAEYVAAGVAHDR